MRAIELRLCDTDYLSDQDGNRVFNISPYEQDYNCKFSGSFIAACRLGVRALCLETIGSINVQSITQQYSKFRLTADYTDPEKKTQIYSIEANDLEIINRVASFNCDNITASGLSISGNSLSIYSPNVFIDNIIVESGCSLYDIGGEISNVVCSSLNMKDCAVTKSNFMIVQAPPTGTGVNAVEIEKDRSSRSEITNTYFGDNSVLIDTTPYGLIRFISSEGIFNSYWSGINVTSPHIDIIVSRPSPDAPPSQSFGGYGKGLNLNAKYSVNISNHSYLDGTVTTSGLTIKDVEDISADLEISAQSISIQTRGHLTEDDMHFGETLSGQIINIPISCKTLGLIGASVPYNYIILNQPISVSEGLLMTNFINNTDIVMGTGSLAYGINNGTIRCKKATAITGVTGPGTITYI